MTANTKKLRRPIDVRIEGHGSLYLLRPQTPEAKLWLIENVGTPADEVPWIGGAVVCEPRYLGNILKGLRADGLVCQ